MPRQNKTKQTRTALTRSSRRFGQPSLAHNSRSRLACISWSSVPINASVHSRNIARRYSLDWACGSTQRRQVFDRPPPPATTQPLFTFVGHTLPGGGGRLCGGNSGSRCAEASTMPGGLGALEVVCSAADLSSNERERGYVVLLCPQTPPTAYVQGFAYSTIILYVL